MAHSCPECGLTCHCNGDLDDLLFAGSPEEENCTCCICKQCGDTLEFCMCDDDRWEDDE